MPLDDIRLSFDEKAQAGLSALLFVIMFGIALGLKVEDFRRLARRPRLVLVGGLLQMLVLPALTFAVVSLIAPTPSMAFGMMVVAACPGGNFSNFLTLWARGDVALSVSLTALSSALAVFTTPANTMLWASLHPQTAPLLHALGIDRSAFLAHTALTLGVPLGLGMVVAARWPELAKRLAGPCRSFSMLCLGVFLLGALASNWRELRDHGAVLMPPVIAHNALAVGLGYFGSRAFRLPESARRSLTIEVGIHNAGLGLVILLTHFPTLGGAALIAAAWGFWHLVSGSLLAWHWSKKPLSEGEGAVETRPAEDQPAAPGFEEDV